MAPQSFNTKSPTIKRIMREAAELSSAASPDYYAAPLESNLFEWHFTVRGPSDSPFSAGIYHGRITLPSQYPLRPPSFRFLTPSGRFECNREICLSISGFHEETWQPAWGIRTALLALRSHMDVPAKGQVGGIESDAATRRRLAEGSRGFTCQTCGRSNTAILQEQEELAKANEAEGVARKEEEKVPEELKLVYKDDLKSSSDPSASPTPTPTTAEPSKAIVAAAADQAPAAVAPAAPSIVQVPLRPRARQNNDVKLDAAIWVVSGLLIILVSRMAIRLFL